MQRQVDRVVSLQWLRATAAVMVLLYHAGGYLETAQRGSWAKEAIPNWFGPVGVAMFFALSGHLMAELMFRTSWQQFLLHRIVRIYPTFLLVTLLFSAASHFTGIPINFDALSLTLAPVGSISYPLMVEWTLVFEVSFYLFVTAIIAFGLRNKALDIVAGWLCIVFVLGYYYSEDFSRNLFGAFGLARSSLVVPFAAGMLITLISPPRFPVPVVTLLFGAVLFHLGVSTSGVMGRWGYGAGAALLVYSLAVNARRVNTVAIRWLDAIGNRAGGYSYALYLIHVPVVLTVYKATPQLDAGLSFTIAILAAIALAIPVGEIDLRLYAMLRRRVDGLPQVGQTILAGTYAVIFVGIAIFFRS